LHFLPKSSIFERFIHLTTYRAFKAVCVLSLVAPKRFATNQIRSQNSHFLRFRIVHNLSDY